MANSIIPGLVDCFVPIPNLLAWLEVRKVFRCDHALGTAYKRTQFPKERRLEVFWVAVAHSKNALRSANINNPY